MTVDGHSMDSDSESDGGAPTTSEYVRTLRMQAGLDTAEVAQRAAVTQQWLERFEAGLVEEGLNYDLLMSLVRATQPPRPDWWDSGHEHDLHLPPDAVRNRDRNRGYWEKIEQVRAHNREVGDA
ncbi:MAG: helix-turn-helix domain-containing protein [Acidimicrobiales bacterium]